MLDAPLIVKIEEKEYKVEGFTQEIQDYFDKYMQHHDFTLLKHNKEKLGDDYHDLVKKHLLDIQAGRLSFFSKYFFEFILDKNHLAQLLWLCLSKHQSLPRDTVVKWIKDCGDEPYDLFLKLAESKKN